MFNGDRVPVFQDERVLEIGCMTSLSWGPEGSEWLAGGSGSGNPGSRLGVNPTLPEAELGIGQKHQVNGSSLESLRSSVQRRVSPVFPGGRPPFSQPPFSSSCPGGQGAMHPGGLGSPPEGFRDTLGNSVWGMPCLQDSLPSAPSCTRLS